MLFNSLHFFLFFPIICVIYFLLPTNRSRVYLLLGASYYFYMSWEPVYALLLLSSTVITYLAGLVIDKSEGRQRTFACVAAVVLNLSALFFYKYFKFAGGIITEFLNFFDIKLNVPQMDILLPVGISFYIFQALGYSIDVYRRQLKVEKDFVTYALFISFFPQLVAGPIERASNILPQFKSKKIFTYENFETGLKFMLWGFFMKICIADRLSGYVDAVFNNYMQHNGTSLLLATFFFTIQIYCDFCGYSLIAVGTAKIMGYNLMENFHRPYFSRSIRDFWRRWHISLSTWFKDYLYIPLGGNRVSKTRHKFNLFTTFLVSGIWHGANSTFIIWGGLHGLYQIGEIVKDRYVPEIRIFPTFQKIMSFVITFLLVMFTWIFFRANTAGSAFLIIKKIFTEPGMLFRGEGLPSLFLSFLCILILLFKEVKDEMNWDVKFVHSKNFWVSNTSIALLIAFIILSAAFNGSQFIYFQF